MATGSEALVIEGKNEVTLKNSFLYGEKLCGVMIYQSYSGDAETGIANFTMTGGALKAGSGPLIFVTNTAANITLKEVDAVESSGQLLKVSTGRWGREGENGGILTCTADRQILTGTIVVDQASTLALRLMNGSAFKGSINTDHTGKEVSVSLDATSTWNVTGDSYISSMIFPEESSEKHIGNIIGNGHTIFYDSSKCPELKGGSYELQNGGELKPVV
jgi:hypothetical protein